VKQIVFILFITIAGFLVSACFPSSGQGQEAADLKGLLFFGRRRVGLLFPWPMKLNHA